MIDATWIDRPGQAQVFIHAEAQAVVHLGGGCVG